MRIIAGKAKGHILRAPREVSRPTTDRVRESIFGIFSARLEGARVLDLFAGSGALGLEALSRGAASCDFVEQDRGAARVLSENLKKTRLIGGQVHQQEVGSFLNSSSGGYDLIFADPPYASAFGDLAGDLVALGSWEKLLAPEGYLIIEREARGKLPPAPGLEMIRERDYGRSRIVIYQIPS